MSRMAVENLIANTLSGQTHPDEHMRIIRIAPVYLFSRKDTLDVFVLGG
jgi:hypothetical protein